MKVNLPKRMIPDEHFDIRTDDDAGVVEFDSDHIDKIFFAFSNTIIVFNIILNNDMFDTYEAIDLMELFVNDAILIIHPNSRVGIFNNGNKHYLLPETFWDEFVAVVLPLQFAHLHKCDNVNLRVRLLSKDDRVLFESDQISLEIKIKGELCTKM